MKKRILLTRLQPRFAELVKQYISDQKMNQTDLAKLVGIDRGHLNKLINGSEHRTLSAYYVEPFIQKGIFSVAQIYDNAPENPAEAEFWKETRKMYEDRKVAEKIHELIRRAEAKGVDTVEFLDNLLKISK